MKKLLSLFKVLFNSWYGISAFKAKASKRKTEILKVLGLSVIIVISFAPILAGYIAFLISFYNTFVMMGQPGVIITMGVVASSLVVLLFGFLFVISTFYFSRDTEHLVSLPLNPSTILGAKFGVILSTEYITEFPLVLPPVIIYGIKSGAGLLYYIYSVIGVLTVPIIPLCLTSIIAVVIMRFINIGKKKDLFSIIGGIIGMFLILGVQLFIQRTAVSGNTEMIARALFSKDGLINTIARDFPPSKWISLALINYNSFEGFLNLLIFLVVTFIFIVSFEYMGEKLFLGGFLGFHEVEAKRKKIDEKHLSSEITVRSKVWAIFWREFKIMNRVPIFFMNCVFVVFLVPIIFIIMPIMGGNGSSKAFALLVNGQGGVYIATLAAIGIGIFTSVANMTAPTSISREGSEFFVSKYIPVSPREQILGKYFHAIAIALAGDIITVFAIWFILKLSFVNLIVILLATGFAAAPITAIALSIDLFKPYLNWDNPTKAVKQNINGIAAMLFNALWNAALLIAAGSLIKNTVVSYMVVIGVYALLGIVTYKVLIAYANKRYAELEGK